MATFLAPDPIQGTWFIPGSNTPANGGQLFFYANLSSTKQTVYKNEAGTVAWSNPIVLDSGGNLPSGGLVWFTAGQTYTCVFAPSTDSDPPVSPYRTMDDLTGINDVSSSVSEWVAGSTPTYVSVSSFTVTGDQTTTYQPGRRLKFTVTGGTAYGTILTSTFAVVTTVTMLMDNLALDSGLSAVWYGLLSSTNPSYPVQLDDSLFRLVDGTNRTKGVSFEVSSVAASTTVNLISPATSGTIALISQLGLTSTGAYLPLPMYHIAGWSIGNNATSTAMDIGAGQCRDSTDTVNITTTGFTNKTISSWAAGSSTGAKMSAAAFSTNCWYAWYALGGSSGAADVGFDLAFPPNVPTTTNAFPYYRYIGARKSNSTTVWRSFTQIGDYVLWQTPLLEFAVQDPGDATTTQTCDLMPRGVQVAGQFIAGLTVNGGALNAIITTFYAWPNSQTNVVPSHSSNSGGALTLSWQSSFVNGYSSGVVTTLNPIWINTSAQMRWRISSSHAALQVRMWAIGWTDPRGKDGINI